MTRSTVLARLIHSHFTVLTRLTVLTFDSFDSFYSFEFLLVRQFWLIWQSWQFKTRSTFSTCFTVLIHLMPIHLTCHKYSYSLELESFWIERSTLDFILRFDLYDMVICMIFLELMFINTRLCFREMKITKTYEIFAIVHGF